ncbi:hypothetical protein DITRI_Ditri12bG0043900 [Diplodiscus trichospermus]
MGSGQDIELINLAIQKLIEEKRIKDTSDDKLFEDDDERLLSRLLSQLEALKGGDGSNLLEEVTSRTVDKAETKSENGSGATSGCGEIGVEEIVKELKAVKRQNTITHCLLSVMIVVITIWQLSEMSLFLKVKNGLSHPFRTFGSMLVGMLPSPGNNILDADKNSSSTKNNNNHLADSSLPSVKMPELPHVEFPHMGSSSEGH